MSERRIPRLRALVPVVCLTLGLASCGAARSDAMAEPVAFVCVELVDVPIPEEDVEAAGAEFSQQYQATVCVLDAGAEDPAPRRLDDRLIAPGQPIAVVGDTIAGLNRSTEGEGFEWFAFDGSLRTTTGPSLGTPTRIDDGRLVGADGGRIVVLDAETRRELSAFSLDVAHAAVEDAAAGRVVVIGNDADWSDEGRTLIVVDFSGDEPAELLRQRLEPLATACVDHSGHRLVVATTDGGRLVDLDSGEETALADFGGIDCAWSPDDAHVVGIDLALMILDTDSLEVQMHLEGAALGVSPAWLDGDRVVVAALVEESADEAPIDLVLVDVTDRSERNLTDGFDIGAAFPATDR